MTYRVMFYDLSGKLVCWYSTPNKFEAERHASRKSQWCTTKVECINA
jgi:hypothetical protein